MNAKLGQQTLKLSKQPARLSIHHFWRIMPTLRRQAWAFALQVTFGLFVSIPFPLPQPLPLQHKKFAESLST
jgi:hypothetical protein